ncbi:MAG: 4-hydroxy-tetrahydrodipicolinate reductase [Acidobacteriia bacterium]|jgi:4-hydroxy-tetrahydrodipicolinate reductase|nr:4-hydroxy-tetrahydrodipicolinate reductase [Terriglobia bacterium]
MKIALIGYGNMGKDVELLALKQGHQIIARVDPLGGDNVSPTITEELLSEVNVCIEFAQPQSTLPNIQKIVELGKPIVIGTTDWYHQIPQVRKIIQDNGVGCVYAPNFSLGLNIFLQIVKTGAKLLHSFDNYDAFAMEIHHRKKMDSPSGTAKKIGDILLEYFPRKQHLVTECLNRKILPEELHLVSARSGYFPGTHSVIFDSEEDSLELVHRARSRAGFSFGALLAAQWIQERKGFYAFEQVLKNLWEN